MGSKFFANSSPKITGGGNMNMEARSFGSSIGAGRGASIGAQKDLGAALAINKAKSPLAKSSGSSAYPTGLKHKV